MGIMEQAVMLKNQLKHNPANSGLRQELDQLQVLFQSNIAAY
jgi:hypothetical protein